MGDGGFSIGSVSQNVTGAGAVGQVGQNTATVANNNGAEQDWSDAAELASKEGGDTAVEAVTHLERLHEAETLDETQQAEARGVIETLKDNAPDALRLVGKLLEKGPMGAAGMLAGMVADRIEA